MQHVAPAPPGTGSFTLSGAAGLSDGDGDGDELRELVLVRDLDFEPGLDRGVANGLRSRGRLLEDEDKDRPEDAGRDREVELPFGRFFRRERLAGLLDGPVRQRLLFELCERFRTKPP